MGHLCQRFGGRSGCIGRDFGFPPEGCLAAALRLTCANALARCDQNGYINIKSELQCLFLLLTHIQQVRDVTATHYPAQHSIHTMSTIILGKRKRNQVSYVEEKVAEDEDDLETDDDTTYGSRKVNYTRVEH
jgi:hypothetical protein